MDVPVFNVFHYFHPQQWNPPCTHGPVLGDDDQGRRSFVEAAASRLSLSGSLGNQFPMSRNDADFYMHAFKSKVEQVELRPHTPVFHFSP